MSKPQNQKAERPKRKTRHVWLNVLPDDLWLKVRDDETIWEALQKTDVELGGDCGGLGICGKCKVKVLSEIAPPHPLRKRNSSMKET
ncbi:2Fe-2S iron-sulfur cluster-binding protein [Chloroflexota bacterium]